MKFSPVSVCILLVVLLASCKGRAQQDKMPGNSFSVAFYNIENLFDTVNNPATNDEDFTPSGKLQWNAERLKSKLENMSGVIAKLTSKGAPDFLGLCEIENREVLNMLIAMPDLKKKRYAIAHFESPDERGIDVAFLYDSLLFNKVTASKITVKLGDGDHTRDILRVTGLIKGKDTMHFFVCHFPSRRGDKDESAAKRGIASQTLLNFIISKQLVNSNTVILGDFNDNPTNKSMNKLYYGDRKDSTSPNERIFNNLFWSHYKNHQGTISFQGHWDLFDQILVSNTLYKTKGGIDYVTESATIFNRPPAAFADGKKAGQPHRTFNGSEYLNGYSDHFPVMAWFSYE